MRISKPSIGAFASASDATRRRSTTVAEPKLDGLAVSLTYRRRPARARGDPRRRHDRRGRHRQRAHHALGAADAARAAPAAIEVRGEVFMPLAGLRAHESRGRGGAARKCLRIRATPPPGSLRQLDARITATRVRWTPSSTASGPWRARPPPTQSRAARAAAPLGAARQSPRSRTVRGARRLSRVFPGARASDAPRRPYQIDGVVYKVDSRADQERSASCRARRAGRSRTSSRPMRRSRWCARSSSRSDAPAY